MSRLVRPLAVLLSRFPTVTETFILREMAELDRRGVPVVPWPLLREKAPPIHDEAAPFMARALFSPFLDWEIVRAVLRQVLARPWGTLRACLAALAASRSLNAFTGALAILPKSAWAAERLREMGVGHVHAHFATHPATAAWLASRLGADELPWSVTVHAHDIFISRAGLRGKLSSARFVRCISEFNGRFLRRTFGQDESARERYPVIHCGIEPALYERRPRAGRPLCERPAQVLCIASLRPYKGLVHLVEAMRLLRERGLELCCTVLGEGPQRSELEARIAELGLEDRLLLAGTRSQAEVARELASTDLFVLPSIIAPNGQMEGIPVALMEAMAARVPVVATRLSGIPELVRDGQTGLLVEPGDGKALAEAIALCLEDETAAARRAEAGRSLVEAEFELGGVVEALLERLLEEGLAWEGPEVIAELAREGAALCSRSEASRIGILRWKEGADALSAELLLPDDGASRPRRLVVKRHLEAEHARKDAIDRARNEHAALAHLHAAGALVPEPLAIDESAGVVLMEAIEGPCLDTLLRRALRRGRAGRLCLAAVEEAGRSLAALNRLAPPCAGGEKPETPLERLLRELEEDAATACARGLPARLVSELAARAARELRAASWGADCWSHGDAWPGNMLCRPDGTVVLIDLEGARAGLPGEDAANMLEHLALAAPWTRPLAVRAARSVARAFLEGYDGPAPSPALRVARALALVAWSPRLREDAARGSTRRRHLARLRALASELPA